MHDTQRPNVNATRFSNWWSHVMLMTIFIGMVGGSVALLTGHWLIVLAMVLCELIELRIKTGRLLDLPNDKHPILSPRGTLTSATLGALLFYTAYFLKWDTDPNQWIQIGFILLIVGQMIFSSAVFDMFHDEPQRRQGHMKQFFTEVLCALCLLSAFLLILFDRHN